MLFVVITSCTQRSRIHQRRTLCLTLPRAVLPTDDDKIEIWERNVRKIFMTLSDHEVVDAALCSLS